MRKEKIPLRPFHSSSKLSFLPSLYEVRPAWTKFIRHSVIYFPIGPQPWASFLSNSSVLALPWGKADPWELAVEALLHPEIAVAFSSLREEIQLGLQVGTPIQVSSMSQHARSSLRLPLSEILTHSPVLCTSLPLSPEHGFSCPLCARPYTKH